MTFFGTSFVQKRSLRVAAMASLLAVSACADSPYTGVGPKTGLGAALGAAGGGLLAASVGGETEGILAGVLLGGLVGGAIGSALDAQDRRIAEEHAYQSLEYNRSGYTSRWRNPDSGHSGTFTPVRTYQYGDGIYCREYTQTINVGGQRQQGYGTACRQPDGSWQIQN